MKKFSLNMNASSSLSADLQEELLDVTRRFIRYGVILDVPTRKYLVAFIQSKFITGYQLPEELQAGYFLRFEKELETTLSDHVLLEMTQKHQHLAVQVVKDLLHWLKKTMGKTQATHPFEDELQQLQSWAVRPIKQLKESWQYVIKAVGSFYTINEFDSGFHEAKLKEAMERLAAQHSDEQVQEIERIFTDLLSEWDVRLQAKILEYQLKNFRKELEDLQGNLLGKAREFKRLTELVQPFEDYAGEYWNLSQGLWSKTSFNVLDQYGDLLEKEEELKELAKMLGQLREAELLTEEEQYYDVEIREQKQHDPRLKSEIAGIFESNDLNQLVSSEAAFLADQKLETVFLKKFADEALLTHQYKDFETIQEGAVVGHQRELQRRKEKGPFIVCVDTSGSMEGTPEYIAKVLCFGILKMAAAENRKAYLINFSTGIQTLNLQNIANNVDELAHFLTMSFMGGTDITLALSEALHQLQENQYK
ncbi:MAG: hypothetical protein AAF193_05240, partial [Bacteroidota bacterium]